MSIQQDLATLFQDVVDETGVSLRKGTADKLAAYAAERSAQLAKFVGVPGFQEAVRVERDNVALEAGILAVQGADQADARLVGVIQGALTFAARLS